MFSSCLRNVASGMPSHQQIVFRSLGVSESCQTRIPGSSNPRVFWTNALDFSCTWEHLGAPATSQEATTRSLGATTRSLGAPGSASDKSESNNHKPGSTDKSGSTLNHCTPVWEKHHLLWECYWCP